MGEGGFLKVTSPHIGGMVMGEGGFSRSLPQDDRDGNDAMEFRVEKVGKTCKQLFRVTKNEK